MNKHYVLHDHHNGKTTIVIGELCYNSDCGLMFHNDESLYFF